jgi:hypothetical protein
MNYFAPILRKLIEDILNAFLLFYLSIKNGRQRNINLKSQDSRKITDKRKDTDKNSKVKTRKEDLIMSIFTAGTQVVEDAKRELIEKIKSNIDLDQVKAICREQYGIQMIEGLDLNHGDIVSYNDQVAYRLDFDIRFSMSVLLDNEGNCISTSLKSNDQPSTPEERIEEAGRQADTEYSEF